MESEMMCAGKTDIWNSLGFLMAKTHARLKYIYSQRLKPFGLTPEQWALMLKLSDKEGVSPTDLSHLYMKDKSYTTRILDKLEADKLVVRTANQWDKRSYLIYLTDKGRDLLAQATPAMVETQKWVAEALGAEECQSLKSSLQNIYHHVMEICPEGRG